MEKKLIKFKNDIKEMSIDEVCVQFLPYIKKTAYQFSQSLKNTKVSGDDFNIDDLEQIAYMGLLKAYNTYSIEKDILFLTYMARICNNEIFMYIRKNKIKTDDIFISLNDTLQDKDGNSTEYYELIANQKDYFIDVERHDLLKSLLFLLNAQEKEIIKMCYFKDINQRDIGKKLNISQSYVSRIIKKAIKKLRGGTALMEKKKLIKISEDKTDYFSCGHLLKIYKPYLKKIASYYYKKCCSSYKKTNMDSFFIEFDDFFQYASLGIVNAFNNYDISKNIIFFTFMKPHCEGQIKRNIRDTLKIRRKDFKPYTFLSMETNLNENSEDKEITLKEKISDNKNLFEMLENKMFVKSLLEKLNSKERCIIEDIFFNEMTQQQIASKLNISQAQVSRTIKKAISKLKNLNDKKATNKNEGSHKKMNIISDFKKYDKENGQGKSFIMTLKDYCKFNNLDTNKVLIKLKSDPETFNSIQEAHSSHINNLIKNSDKNKEIETEDNFIESDKIKSSSIFEKTPVAAKQVQEENKFGVNLPEGVKIREISLEGSVVNIFASHDKFTLSARESLSDLGLEDLKAVRNDIDSYIKIFESL